MIRLTGMRLSGLGRCVYDNPATWRREAWQGGKLLCDVAAEVLLQKGFNGNKAFPWILNCGPWQEGATWGDKGALIQAMEVPRG